MSKKVTILKKTNLKIKRRYQYHCKCHCGKEFLCDSSRIKNKSVKSCGCLPKGRVHKNLSGKKIDKLLVLKIHHKGEDGSYYYLCQCDCGNEKIILASTLRDNFHYKHCGCQPKIAWNAKHVGEISGEYWCHLLDGAKKRNIKVMLSKEDAWEKYIQQDGLCALSNVKLQFRPHWTKKNEQTASLDRIDSSKPYEKNNIQWVHKIVNKMKNTISEQEFIDWCNKISKNRGNKCQ